MTEGAYRRAGVDIDAKYRAVKDANEAIRSTFTEGVLGDVGSFGGLFDLGKVGAAGEILVASTDGVGTKVEVAARANRLTGVGADLVNHCVNDILVQGARPLFFLDYIAVGRMESEKVSEVIRGLAGACAANRCALLGGETAEMPGVYLEGAMDVAGTIIGAVSRERLVDGARIRPGDVALALPSSGLHTNGFSLARKVLFDDLGLDLDSRPDELQGESLVDALLAVHRSYLDELMPLVEDGTVHGMGHITGGGLPDNLPRVLPADVSARIETAAVPRPPVFDLICERGSVSKEESYRVFNMGFGMVFFVAPDAVEHAQSVCAANGHAAVVCGEAVAGDRRVILDG
ncbi:MAG: phosphoribosylformylglycinamidine cyclo-ligase [Planctomycetota bacterium]